MVFLRKMLPVLAPNLVVQTIWLIAMSRLDLWFKFRDNYFISIMMIFGSFVAGATSEGKLTVVNFSNVIFYASISNFLSKRKVKSASQVPS